MSATLQPAIYPPPHHSRRHHTQARAYTQTLSFSPPQTPARDPSRRALYIQYTHRRRHHRHCAADVVTATALYTIYTARATSAHIARRATPNSRDAISRLSPNRSPTGRRRATDTHSRPARRSHIHFGMILYASPSSARHNNNNI